MPVPLLPRHNELSGIIVDCAFRVHSTLGPGLLEHVYEECLAYELSRQGIAYRKQVPIPVICDEVKLEIGYRADFLIENLVLVELKAVDKWHPVHDAQLLTYIKLAGVRIGIGLNFNVPVIKDGIHRRVI
jgi:GxxExxY protein